MSPIGIVLIIFVVFATIFSMLSIMMERKYYFVFTTFAMIIFTVDICIAGRTVKLLSTMAFASVFTLFMYLLAIISKEMYLTRVKFKSYSHIQTMKFTKFERFGNSYMHILYNVYEDGKKTDETKTFIIPYLLFIERKWTFLITNLDEFLKLRGDLVEIPVLSPIKQEDLVRIQNINDKPIESIHTIGFNEYYAIHDFYVSQK